MFKRTSASVASVSKPVASKFSDLLVAFTGVESNRAMGVKAETKPEKLTKKELFEVSFLIERIQGSSQKREDVVMLEELRHTISSAL